MKEDDTLDWELSQPIEQNPSRSTRGAVEPTVAEFNDGRMLAVIRGSNDVRPELPGYRWYSVSRDGGYTWAPIAPWTFTNGEAFHSPSSCSQLLSHSNGRYYWIGNLVPENPRGNRPRHPLVIAEVDPETLLVIRDSVFTVDDRKPGESEQTSLSNFLADEDRETGDIIIYVPRCNTRGPGDLTSDTVLHRVGL
jgi:hypothetical protein